MQLGNHIVAHVPGALALVHWHVLVHSGLSVEQSIRGLGQGCGAAAGFPLLSTVAWCLLPAQVAATVPLAAPDQAVSNAAKYPSNGQVTVPNPPSTGWQRL